MHLQGKGLLSVDTHRCDLLTFTIAWISVEDAGNMDMLQI
jgi:hypothetical protein